MIVFKSSFFNIMSEKRPGREKWKRMGSKNYRIITNNPLVLDRLKETHNVDYREISYEDILREVRDRIHEGHTLLSHPLSGSVKPNETPYKSIMISERKGEVDEGSLRLIENAIQACRKFIFKSDLYEESVYDDFQLIDWTLLESGMASADVW